MTVRIYRQAPRQREVAATIAVGAEMSEIPQPGVQMLDPEIECIEHPYRSVPVLGHGRRTVETSRFDTESAGTCDDRTVFRQTQQFAGFDIGEQKVAICCGGNPPAARDISSRPYHAGGAAPIVENP